MNKHHAMQWVESKGGPLVLLEQARLSEWSGARGRDYESACTVTDEIGTVAIAGRDVLVLGDQPHRTSWLSDSHGGLLVRWVYADSERSVLGALSSLPEELFEDTGVTILVEGPCRLVDSADPGNSAITPGVEVPISPGTYRVETGLLDAGSEVRLLLHRLVRLG